MSASLYSRKTGSITACCELSARPANSGVVHQECFIYPTLFNYAIDITMNFTLTVYYNAGFKISSGGTLVDLLHVCDLVKHPDNFEDDQSAVIWLLEVIPTSGVHLLLLWCLLQF